MRPRNIAPHCNNKNSFIYFFSIFFFQMKSTQGFRVLPVFSKGADEFFFPPKKNFVTSAYWGGANKRSGVNKRSGPNKRSG